MQRFLKSYILQPLKYGLRYKRVSEQILAAKYSSSTVIDRESPYWRNSANIILAAKDASALVDTNEGENISPFDYKVLMIERSKKSKFMAGSSNTFPGGTTCDADFSLEWANVFRYCTKRDMADIVSDLNIGRKRAPILLASDNHTAIPADLGFRIAAIRETFMNSGILLAKGARMPNVEDIVIDEFRGKVQKDPNKFATYCKELQIVPDVWALQEWSNWLTPVADDLNGNDGTSKHRYDTLYYLCCLDWIPLVKFDENELTDAKWISPEGYFSAGPVKFSSQPFEMARIYNFQKLAILHTFATERARLGLERYMSVFLKCKDGMIAVLPGDDLYPVKPDYEGLKELKPKPHSIEELREVTKRHHRHEFIDGSKVTSYVCNISFKYGQPIPHRSVLSPGCFIT